MGAPSPGELGNGIFYTTGNEGSATPSVGVRLDHDRCLGEEPHSCTRSFGASSNSSGPRPGLSLGSCEASQSEHSSVRPC
jgi:hypothetical protein